jgi:protease-4
MAGRHPILRGFGVLALGMLVFFVAVFFYAYFKGGEEGVLTMVGGDTVGIVELQGAIDDSREVIENLKRFGDASAVKAVVIRIDTPGGAVAPVQEIYSEVEKLKKKKPVVASMGSMATSGGYYVAAACQQIVANPGTLTGSIGVIMELGNVEELLKKIGVKGSNIKSGPNKDIGSPYHPLTAEGKEILQSLVDNVHAQFVSAVAKGRNLPEAKVRVLADGRVYSGEQAKNLGLVDVMGNLEDAIELVARRAGIKGEPQVLFARREEKYWWQKFLFSFVGKELAHRMAWGLRYEWSPSFIR